MRRLMLTYRLAFLILSFFINCVPVMHKIVHKTQTTFLKGLHNTKQACVAISWHPQNTLAMNLTERHMSGFMVNLLENKHVCFFVTFHNCGFRVFQDIIKFQESVCYPAVCVHCYMFAQFVQKQPYKERNECQLSRSCSLG